MAMEKIDVEKAKEIAEEKGLKPGKVITTNGVQFTYGDNENVDVIDWDEFERLLEKRDLAVFNSDGWMKIMADED